MASTMKRAMARCAMLGGAMLGGAVLAMLAAPAPASAAAPDLITIEGAGLGSALQVRAESDRELFTAVLNQVSWMANAKGQTGAPPEDVRGPKYTLIVFVEDDARQAYDLYPLAEGGPRAFRPAKQPDLRSTTNAWFFGRLNMSEILRIAGVPLPARPDAVSGGIGGGIGGDSGDQEPTAASLDPLGDLRSALSQWRHLFLINGAVLVLIAAGLGGVSLLIRPKR